jgi:hypothetical protein
VAALIFFCGLSFGQWDFEPNRGESWGNSDPCPSLLDGALHSSHPPNKEVGHCACGVLEGMCNSTCGQLVEIWARSTSMFRSV